MIRIVIVLFLAFMLNVRFALANSQTNVSDSIKLLLDKNLELAMSMTSQNSDSASLLVEEAMILAKKFELLNEQAELIRIKGLIEFYRVNYAGALDYFMESRDLFKRSGYTRGEIKATSNVALIYKYQNLINEGLEIDKKALNLAKEANDSLMLSRIYNNIAVSYRDLKDYDSALQFYLKAIDIKYAINAIDDIGLNLNNVGNVYLLQNELDSAHKYFNKSLESNISNKQLQFEGNSHENLGKYFLKQNEYRKALEEFEKCLNIYKDLGIVYEIEEAAKQLHKVYALTNNYKKAYEMHILLKQMADSANSLQTIQKLTAIEKQSEFEKQDELNRIELDKQKQIRNIAIVFVLLIGLFLIYVYASFIKKKRLSQRLILQRDEILSKNEEIQAQHDEIVIQHKTLEHQTKELTTHRQNTLDSLSYAEHIQGSLLPSPKLFQKTFADHFIFYRPKDIVSGDFYWIKQKNGTTLFAAADCTGHGVPGAFMSIMGISFLNEIIQKRGADDPAVILEKLRKQVKLTLNPELMKDKSKNYIELYLEAEIKDGMDIALCAIDKSNKLTYCGANLPVFIIRNGELIELEPHDNPVGVYLIETPFENKTFQLEEDDMIYLFSDGYFDQFGGENNQKFFVDNFHKLLIRNADKMCHDQHEILNDTIEKWMGIQNQTDDMLVMGLRVE